MQKLLVAGLSRDCVGFGSRQFLVVQNCQFLAMFAALSDCCLRLSTLHLSSKLQLMQILLLIVVRSKLIEQPFIVRC